jgi:hypothetical protein
MKYYLPILLSQHIYPSTKKYVLHFFSEKKEKISVDRTCYQPESQGVTNYISKRFLPERNDFVYLWIIFARIQRHANTNRFF